MSRFCDAPTFMFSRGIGEYPSKYVDYWISYTITNLSIRLCDDCNEEAYAIFLETLH